MSAGAELSPWPRFEPDELAAVEQVLRSGRVNYWTGDRCREFEAAWSRRHGGLHALAMANGSLTLDAAIRALGVGPGDEVIVSPRSYVASAMCAVLAGARPVFADVDPDSGNVTAETLEAVRSPRTRACIPVHIAGWPCDMPAIAAWAARHGVHVIEDCAQAHGAHVDGRPVGTWGVFSSWSFCQDKIMTTGGEGGMLCTPDEGLWRRCWQMSQHGKDHARMGVPGSGVGFRWLVAHEGTNLRMTEMQAAIGICQLAKLDRWVESRRRNAGILREALAVLPRLEVPVGPRGHAQYRLMARVRDAAMQHACLSALQRAGLPANVGSCPEIYREPLFIERGLAPAGPLPGASRLGQTSLAFLVHHTIEADEMRRHAAAVIEALAPIAG